MRNNREELWDRYRNGEWVPDPLAREMLEDTVEKHLGECPINFTTSMFLTKGDFEGTIRHDLVELDGYCWDDVKKSWSSMLSKENTALCENLRDLCFKTSIWRKVTFDSCNTPNGYVYQMSAIWGKKEPPSVHHIF